MPALYSHISRSTGTVLTAEIFNSSHQNHIDNGVPQQLDDFSSSAAQMQSAIDPGEASSESLATSLSGELERLRFAIKDAKAWLQIEPASPQWYSTPTAAVPIAKGGTGATTAAAARTTLGSTATGNAVFIAASAAAARATLGSTVTGDAVFIAATAAAARATLGVQTATTSAEGLVELATQPEMDAGTAGKVPTTDLNKISLGTSVATTSGTSHDFTGLPAGTRKVTINFASLSTNGTSLPLIQLGDAGGIEPTGYLGSGQNSSATAITLTNGFGFANVWSTLVILHGSATLTLLNASTNTWAWSASFGRSDSGGIMDGGGSKSLSSKLTTVRLTTVNGTDTFDAGSVNITYER